jgi:UDP-N-acetylmuramate--alanine ligase
MNFAKAFLDTDILIVTDIYPARETPIEGVTSQMVIDDIKSLGYENVHYVPDVNNIPALIHTLAQDSDMIITMGAGHIWRQCEPIAQVLDA